MRRLTFTVFGTVQPKGSMRAFVPKGWKRPIVTSANPRLKDWEQNVRACAQQYAGDGLFPGAVSLDVAFYLPKPKSAPKSRKHMTTRPDLSKCIRSTEDALIGVRFPDDSGRRSIIANEAMHARRRQCGPCRHHVARGAGVTLPVPTQRLTPDAFVIGGFAFHATGVTISGAPTFDEYLGMLDFATRAVQGSQWWLADLLKYGEHRPDWQERLQQVMDATTYSEATIKSLKYLGENVAPPRRRSDLPIALHFEVAPLPEKEQSAWLEKAAVEGWSQRDLRLNPTRSSNADG